MAEALKKIQLEDRQGVAVVPLTMAGSVYFNEGDETLQEKVEKTDIGYMKAQRESDVNTLKDLTSNGIDDIHTAGSPYQPQLDSISGDIKRMDEQEYPLRVDYSIEPFFSAGVYRNLIRVRVEEYETGTPKLAYLSIEKGYNGVVEQIYESYKTMNYAEVESTIQYGKEDFRFRAHKQNSDKEVTLVTSRYLCFIGTSTASAATETMATGLTKVLVEDLDMTVDIATEEGEYIWFIVPKQLYIKEIRSSGFEVTLDEPVAKINVLDYGKFNAYRTLNPLGTATWRLVVKQA